MVEKGLKHITKTLLTSILYLTESLETNLLEIKEALSEVQEGELVGIVTIKNSAGGNLIFGDYVSFTEGKQPQIELKSIYEFNHSRVIPSYWDRADGKIKIDLDQETNNVFSTEGSIHISVENVKILIIGKGDLAYYLRREKIPTLAEVVEKAHVNYQKPE